MSSATTNISSTYTKDRTPAARHALQNALVSEDQISGDREKPSGRQGQRKSLSGSRGSDVPKYCESSRVTGYWWKAERRSILSMTFAPAAKAGTCAKVSMQNDGSITETFKARRSKITRVLLDCSTEKSGDHAETDVVGRMAHSSTSCRNSRMSADDGVRYWNLRCAVVGSSGRDSGLNTCSSPTGIGKRSGWKAEPDVAQVAYRA